MQQRRCAICWQIIPECPQPEVPIRSAFFRSSTNVLLPPCTVADAETAAALTEKFTLPDASPWRGYPLAGWATRVNTGANAGSVTLGIVFGQPGTIVMFR